MPQNIAGNANTSEGTPSFFSVIQKRRSIRKYSSKEVEPEKVARLAEAALRAPSSRGTNPWEFVVVTDRKVLEELSGCKPHGAAFLKDAALGIVVCADPGKSDVWVEDASIAATFLLLAAESMGLGACWIQVRGRMFDQGLTAGQRVAQILGLGEGIEVEAIVALGYPDEVKAPHPAEKLLWEKLHKDRYGQAYPRP
jgi:nitroreductase